MAEKGLLETGYDELIPVPNHAAVEMSQAFVGKAANNTLGGMFFQN